MGLLFRRVLAGFCFRRKRVIFSLDLSNLVLGILAMALGCQAIGTAVSAQNVDPNSDLGQFRELRAAGMKALDDKDSGTALLKFNAAQHLMPDSPSVILLKVQLFQQNHDMEQARAAMHDYLLRGYTLDLGRNPDFNALWTTELNDLAEANVSPLGNLHVLAALPGFTISEAMTYAPQSDQLYVSGIRTGKLMSISPQGTRDMLTFRPGVAAYGLGLHNGMIWAATAASRQTKGFEAKLNIASKIVAINPANGQIDSQFADKSKDRRFGHLLAGRDDLYVTDTDSGEVLRLNGYAGDLQVLVPEGYLDSPEGLSENADSTILMVSDFISGLYRVDLKEGTLTHLLPPTDGTLIGISSLSRYGQDLIGIQTGFKPNRVVRIHLSDDWKEVRSIEVLMRSPKYLSQPSQGVVAGDRFVFVAKSQWGNMDDQGNPISTDPEPSVIGQLTLVP